MKRARIMFLLWGSLLTLLLAGRAGLAQSTLTYRLTAATFDSGGIPATAGDIAIQGVIGATSGDQFSGPNGPLTTGAQSPDPSPAGGETTFKLFLPVVASDAPSLSTD